LLVALTACSGHIGDASGETEPENAGRNGTGGTGSETSSAGACVAGTTRRVRRLSEREYLNVVTDLLGAAAAKIAAPLLPFEPRVAGFDNQDSELLVSSAFQAALADVAEKLSIAVDATKLAPCATAASKSCLDSFTRAFARKAFGRDPTNDEVTHLLAVAALGTSYATSVGLIVEVILQSPQMLYAYELGPDAPPAGKSATLTQLEIASQLSLLLTGARPDDQLLSAAAAGRLVTAADLDAQVTRLISTPRGQQQLRVFVNGWLDMGAVTDAPKNPVSFPTFTPEIAAGMQEELDAFVDKNVAGGAGTLATLMSATSDHIPSVLASIYGSELKTGPNGPILDPKHRTGILSLPGLLTYHSADQHSGPIERGLLVRRQLLCGDIPPPPASVLQKVATNPIDSNDKARTTRQKYEQHKTQALCASCHSQFDVIGFGMEEMDALGRYRTTENGLPVDTTGQLNGSDVDGPFSGVSALSAKLAGSEDFATCFVHQFFRFAEARAPVDADQCTIDDWSKSFHDAGGHVRDLFAAYLADPGFSTRKEDR
jgi:hypothetical protein